MNNRRKGAVFEEKAALFLQSKNYTIIETNYRCKVGEIDLIAVDRKESTLVFVEVKYRTHTHLGYPEEAVNRKKQQKIYRSAEWYIKEKRLERGNKYRFDVISVQNDQIRHIQNAFGGF